MQIAVQDAVDELLGIPKLSISPQRDFLDQLGNRNGGYDVGDYLALLDRSGVTPSPELLARLNRRATGGSRDERPRLAGESASPVSWPAAGPEPLPVPRPASVVASLNSPNDRDGALIVRIIGEHTGLKARWLVPDGHRTAAPGHDGQGDPHGTIVDGDLLEFTSPTSASFPPSSWSSSRPRRGIPMHCSTPSGYNITLRVK